MQVIQIRPQHKPKVRLKKRFLLLLLVPVAGFVWLSQIEYEVSPTRAQSDSDVAAKATLPWPAEGRAAIGAKGQGLLTNSENADQPVPIASITKLFTALAILDKKPMSAVGIAHGDHGVAGPLIMD
jgi:D-alanyl-D-alanine carboxypeptidase